MKLFIVDDHTGFRSAARALFESAGWDVVGESSGVDGAVESIRRSGATAALVDVQLDDGDGFELVDQLASTLPVVRCVLISSRRRSDLEQRLRISAAAGFISKTDLTPDRVEALLAGPFSPSRAGR